MKICHIADIHQGLGYPSPSPLSRFNDINCILDWSADRIIEEQVDLVLIAGDMFKDAKVMLDRASQEIASIVRFLRKLSEVGIEVIVISGTPSHDAIAAYELMKQMGIHNTKILTEPAVLLGDDAYIACLPGLNRSALMTQDEYKGLPPEQIHRIMTDKITQLCIGMAAQMPPDKPKILMAHMTYQGAETGFTDLMMQHEPILTREAVAGFDLVCLGHIHRPQKIDGKVFYSGPIERLSFNDEDINPGFMIYELSQTDCSDHPFMSKYQTMTSRFIETPARQYVTLDLDEQDIQNYLNSAEITYGYGPGNQDMIKDAIVRLHYSCSEDVAKQINRKALEQALYNAGAFFVSEIKADVQRVDRARDTEVVESLTPVEAVARWCQNVGIEPDETQALCAMTAVLLESGV